MTGVGQDLTPLAISMKPTKPPLLMGGEGEIKMGPLGQSKYYTIPRLEVEGTLKIDGEVRHVKGSGWMDHQWGDMQMFHGYEGWDWFGIQLDNQTEVNAFHFRGPEHSTASATVGVSLPDGQQAITEKLKLSPGRSWTSPETGITYPLEWHISVPDQELELDVKPSLDSQEMIGSRPFCYPELALKPTYWEGSTHVEGTMHGKPVKGRAYMELTGYASPSPFSNDYAELAQQLSKEAEQAGHPPTQPAVSTGTTPPLSAAP